jgi:hypothetical protein
MKIVNLEVFRKMPVGTIFLKYQPFAFEDLQCKGETWDGDFLSENISHWPDCNSSDDFEDKLQLSQDTGESILLDFDSTGRDGCYDDDQLFAVYDRRDVEMLQDKLSRCLDSAYPAPKEPEFPDGCYLVKMKQLLKAGTVYTEQWVLRVDGEWVLGGYTASCEFDSVIRKKEPED